MPKQFLKGIDRSGLERGLFHDLRFDLTGQPRFDFAFNRVAEIRALVTGPNFGCGSSREHAVWGLLQFGIRAIIGTSFAGIFEDNANNNGLLLIKLEPSDYGALMAQIMGESAVVTIDLERQKLTIGELDIKFDIRPDIKSALLLGHDRVNTTLIESERIRAFENVYLAERPWLSSARPPNGSQ